ncbi:hypothetical protein BGX27_000325 [Mortierella sp. AM989]|nr:hypothetical protein BGX27_000325 [Mortierella sp. AM989]
MVVMQPVFRYKRWMEEEKQLKPEGPEQQSPSKPDIGLQSIAVIESQLPPLRGLDASVVGYVTKLEEHTWDMERAKHVEYQAIANSLLQIVGGSLGRHRADDNPVLIGIGLGEFGSSSRMSSLHSSFLSYFVPLVTLRQFFCRNCERYRHRDVMAAENMSQIVRGYLVDQERPEYLHPMTADGRYPWKSLTNSEHGVNTETSNASTAIPISITRSRKRASNSSLPRRSRKASREI